MSYKLNCIFNYRFVSRRPPREFGYGGGRGGEPSPKYFRGLDGESFVNLLTSIFVLCKMWAVMSVTM